MLCLHEREHLSVVHHVSGQEAGDSHDFTQHDAGWYRPTFGDARLFRCRHRHGTNPYHSGLFAKTDSRSVLGVLNDLVICYRAMIDVDGGLQSCNLTDIILKINTMPQRTLQWAHSWDAVQAKLGNPETKH